MTPARWRHPRELEDQSGALRMAELDALIAAGRGDRAELPPVAKAAVHKQFSQRQECLKALKAKGARGQHRISAEKVLGLLDFYENGASIRTAARGVAVAKRTAQEYYALFRCVRPRSFCACGQRADHQGWCAVRFRNSPARQAVMKRMHNNVGA